MNHFGELGASRSRRRFLIAALGAGAIPVRASLKANLQIGTMDTVLKLPGKPEAVTAAKKLGLAAIQVTLGKSADGQHASPSKCPATAGIRQHFAAAQYPDRLHLYRHAPRELLEIGSECPELGFKGY